MSVFLDQMVVLTIDPQERARIQLILYVGFILNFAPFSIGSVLAYMVGRAAQKGLQ